MAADDERSKPFVWININLFFFSMMAGMEERHVSLFSNIKHTFAVTIILF